MKTSQTFSKVSAQVLCGSSNKPFSNLSVAALCLLAAAPAFFVATPVFAGRGASYGSVVRAIESGGVDAITTELERAEHFACPACVPKVKPLIDHPDARVRRVATWWLGRRGLRSELTITAFERLSTSDTRLARNAADILGSLRTPLAVAPLSAALANPIYDGSTRAAMAEALGRIGDPSAKDALARAAVNAPEAEVRAASVSALSELEEFADAGVLVSPLRDRDALVRAAALHALGRLRNLVPAQTDPIVPTLVDLLSDSQSDVRKRAAWCLGEINAPASIAGPALERLTQNDADPLVRSIAGIALGKLR